MKLVLDRVEKRFLTLRGTVEAVRDISLEIAEGEFFVLLGPSGCGKSTLLNLVAGLERPTSGEIRFGSRPVALPGEKIFLPPGARNVAMVFQSYALYPHLSVYDIIAFPLRIAGGKKGKIDDSVKETAALLKITDLLDRRPGELSGGQRQRVAMARALVRRPEIFLLDEPLSNLDVQLRTDTRAELKRLQRELGITTLYVTHDQTEAMTLGDRIALLNEGKIVQVGAPRELYDHPGTPFAATFIGSPPMNLLPARMREGNNGTEIETADAVLELSKSEMGKVKGGGPAEVLVGIRPEHLFLRDKPTGQTFSGLIVDIEPLGRENLVYADIGGKELRALIEEDRKVGERIHLGFDPERLHFFPVNEPC